MEIGKPKPPGNPWATPGLLRDPLPYLNLLIIRLKIVIIFGITDLLIMSIFGGGALTWLICPTPYFDYIWQGTARHGTVHTSAKI